MQVRRVGWSAGAALVAMVLLSGCAPGETTVDQPTASAGPSRTIEASATPVATSPAPVPTSTPQVTQEPANPDAYKFNIPVEKVNELLAMPESLYVDVPPAERGVLVLYFAEKQGIVQQAETYVGSSKYPELNTLPAELSIENTGQEIIAWDAAVERMTTTVTEDGGDFVSSHYIKSIYGALAYRPDESSSYSGMLKNLESVERNGNRVQDMQILAFMEDYAAPKALSEESSIDAWGNTVRIIQAEDVKTGERAELSYAWVQTSETTGLWMRI